MKKRPLPLSNVYAYLESGPVVLVTTADANKANIMTMSWHMMMEFEPPLVGIIMSDRNYSYNTLKRSGECVINIPTVKLLKQVNGCGNTSGRDVDKFARFKLTPVMSSYVKPPRIAECYVGLECTVVDRTLMEKYGMFVVKVVKAWIDRAVKCPRTIHHRGHGKFMIAGSEMKIRSGKA